MLISQWGFACIARAQGFNACSLDEFTATPNSIIDLQGYLLLH
jgi:hypothetical protein